MVLLLLLVAHHHATTLRGGEGATSVIAAVVSYRGSGGRSASWIGIPILQRHHQGNTPAVEVGHEGGQVGHLRFLVGQANPEAPYQFRHVVVGGVLSGSGTMAANCTQRDPGGR